MTRTQFSRSLRYGSAAIAIGLATVSVAGHAQDDAQIGMDAADADVSADGTPVEYGDTIIVTGSRIPQPDLEAISPVTVVNSEAIKQTGATRIEDVLNSLPSVVASQASGVSNGADGTANVDLRGLGPARTLAMVNGRRIVPGEPGPAGSSAADINIIPAAMLKRIEVLTGGASSVYGADAVAGVVNFIMDTDFTGVRIDANYGFYQHNNRNKVMPPLLDSKINAGFDGYSYPKGSVTDGGQFDGTIALGADFDDGRGHAMAYVGYRKVKPVQQSRRDYSACTLQNSNSSTNPTCGGSITNPPGSVLVFDNDITEGTSTLYTFAPGGQLNYSSTQLFNYAPTNYYQRDDERYTAGAFLNYEINDAIKPYLEFMFMDDKTNAQIAPSGTFGTTLTVNCDNPLISDAQAAILCSPENLITGYVGSFPAAQGASYNPDPTAAPIDFFDSNGDPYNIAYMYLLRRNVEGGPRRAELGHQTFRTVLGSQGDLDNVWSYDAYYQYGRVSYNQTYHNEFSVQRLRNALDVVTDTRSGSATFGEPVCRSVVNGSDPNCVPYNVFAGPGGASDEARAYLDATGLQSGRTSEQVASAAFTGLLGEYGIKTPWAADGLALVLGAEYRKESLQLDPDQSFISNDLTGQGAPTLPSKGSFKVTEFFTEAQLPVVQDSFLYDFSLNAGYRRSHYKTSAGKTYDTDTYKFGAELSPVRDVKFRAAYSRAARAPNIQELFLTPYVGLNGSEDPCAGAPIEATDYGCIAQGLSVGQSVTPNPAGQYNGLIGGNADLQPEKGTTKTFGVAVQPSFLPGFSATVDYYDIKIEDAIRAFGQDAILAHCVDTATATETPISCDLVNRDPAGSIWLTPGGYVEDLPGNVGTQQVKGVEATANYNRDIGPVRLNVNFVGTWLDSYKVDNGLTEPYDCAGLYGPTCSVGGTTEPGGPLPKWRHVLRVGGEMQNGLGLSVRWRHIDSVKAETTTDNGTLSGETPLDPGLKLKAYDYIDAVFSANIAETYKFRLGVNNLFDLQPPLVTSGGSILSGSNLCPTGPCNGNTYPGTYDPLGRYFFAGVTIDF